MGANVAFGETDSFAESAEAVEFECVYADSFTNGFYHGGVFLRGLVLIGLEIANVATFKFLNDATGDEFFVGFGG